MSVRLNKKIAAAILIACALQLSACDYFTSAETRVQRAQQKLAASDDRGALIELQNAVHSAPGNIQARLMLADLSLRLGDPKSARNELQQAISHGASGAEPEALAAKVQLALGEYKELLAQIDADKGLTVAARDTYRGLALMGTRQSDEAADTFRRALAADPAYSEARIALAGILAQQGPTAPALAELAKVLVQDPKNPSALSVQGRILAREGDYKASAAALASAHQNAPGKLSAIEYNALLVALTEAQLAANDIPGATATHKELSERAPTAPITQLLAARLAMVSQDYAAAVAQAQSVVTAMPDLVPAKLLLGSALLAQGNLNQAEAQLADAVRLAPESIEARKLLARVNLQLQRPDVAMQVLAPTQQADVNDPQLDALLGWANLQRGDDSAGIGLLERSSAAQPGNNSLKLSLAAAYIRSGQNDKAVALLNAMPATPGDRQRDNLLVTAIAASQGPQAARAQMERIVAANPKDTGVLNLAAAFYARQRDFERARKLLETAATLDPKNVEALMGLARVEAAAGNTVAATDAIKKALAADPSNATARLALAEMTLRSGNGDDAVKQLEQIRAGDADALEPRLLLARIYLQQRKTREADAVLGEVLKHGNDVPAVANVVGQLYLDAGRFDEALGQFSTASRQDPRNVSYALNVARAQMALGKDVNAREGMEKIVAADAGSIPANAALTMFDLRDHKDAAAAARVANLKKLHPNDPSVLMLEGDVAMAAKAYAAASSSYDAAAAITPSAALALRAYRARQLGKLGNPVAPLQAWLQKKPSDVAVRMLLAEGYAASGQSAAAIKEYETVAQGEHPNPMALNNVAWMYHVAGDARAAGVAKQAFTAAPQSPAIADTYGWILVQSGNVQEGLPILEKAVTQSKAQPDIRYHYAAALAKAGKRESAMKELQALASGDQKYASAADARKLLSELGG